MNDKKKPKDNIGQINLEKVEGFEEFINEFYDEIQDRPVRKPSQNPRFDDFDTLNFLDHEYQRLEKINVAFTSKIPNYIEHPQSDALFKIQDKKIDLTQKEIIKLLLADDSPLNRSINLLFKRM